MAAFASLPIAYTEEGLLKAIIEQFGPDERFYTCSAENLTAQGLIDFLKEQNLYKYQYSWEPRQQ